MEREERNERGKRKGRGRMLDILIAERGDGWMDGWMDVLLGLFDFLCFEKERCVAF